ncbi:MAG: hypothetical protein ACJ786_22025, partial [Catenulispora sp.]
PGWVTVVAVVALVPTLAAGAMLLQRASARSRPAAAAPSPADTAAEPSSPAELDPSLFDAAAARPPAAPALRRLPQVDLNGLSPNGIPRVALRAYTTAAVKANREDASCHIRWWLLAGIGLVESGHAHSGGSALPRWNGVAKPPIFGPRLDGRHGFAAIHDTDHGVLDKDKTWDRAVGPMQFLPQTWQSWGDAPNGRPRDPQDIRAAAMAAARYLCAGSADLSKQQGMATAVYSYNHSFDYVRLVLTVAARYAGIDPNSLGVNRLPHDKPAKDAKPHGSASPTPDAASTAPAPGNSAPGSPSPTASGSPSSAPSSAPSPAPSGAPSLPPVPTPSSSPVVLNR